MPASMLSQPPTLPPLSADFSADPLRYAFDAALEIQCNLASAELRMSGSPAPDAVTQQMVMDAMLRAGELVAKLRRVIA